MNASKFCEHQPHQVSQVLIDCFFFLASEDNHNFFFLGGGRGGGCALGIAMAHVHVQERARIEWERYCREGPCRRFIQRVVVAQTHSRYDQEREDPRGTTVQTMIPFRGGGMQRIKQCQATLCRRCHVAQTLNSQSASHPATHMHNGNVRTRKTRLYSINDQGQKHKAR